MTDKDDVAPMLTPHALGFEPLKKEKINEDDEEDEVPEPEPGPVFVDPFIDEIKKLRDAQSPAMKEAIDSAECFGRRWYVDPAEDPEENGLCQQTECDLRTLCELVYTRVGKVETSSSKPEQNKSRKLPKRPRRRFPYVAQGRPVDKLADKLWRLTGGPPALTQQWVYPPVTKPEDLEVAKRIFIERFGDGTLVIKRVNYHLYFNDGIHWMRFWVRHPGGGWLDLSESLAKRVEEIVPTMEQEDMSERTKQHAHRWFPRRVYISHHQHLIQLEKVFTAMGINPI